MAKAVIDPLEVRKFAQELERFNTETHNRMRALQRQFAAVSDTWQDQEQAKFADEFDQTMRRLARFVEMSSEHVPYLLRKCDRAEQYLRQR